MRIRSKPSDLPKARLQLARRDVVPGQDLGYRILNEGSSSLMFSAAYGFSELTADGWQPVRMRMAFAAWGALVAPGKSTREFNARIPKALHPGRYRLETTVTPVESDGRLLGDATERLTIACDFDVRS